MMANRDQQIRDRLGAVGSRYTAGRKKVITALASAPGPRSAAELQRTLKASVPLSSLYRSLAVLEEAGVVEPHLGARGVIRYELAEWLTGHHHHLVCVECGVVEDMRLPGELEGELEALVSQITGIAGFSEEGHTLEVDGRCVRCA